jgi:ATP-dependent helicase HrpB
MQALPIDATLPELLAALAQESRLVLEAPPGAGKTTRVPWALAAASSGPGQVLVSEPRRIAARLAARRVAEERAERLGGAVGYRVRFEDVTSGATRLVYLTEGLLLRRLLDDPELRGVAAVVLDEFHERSLETDVCLALLERLQRERRPELRIVVMSATLDAAPVAEYLHGAPRVRSEGRTYPIEIRHAPGPDERPLEKQVRSAVRDALGRQGNVLVFLPGAAEIRRCQEALAELPDVPELVTLHGDLPLNEQVRAVAPSQRQRVVLATNVAESSVTLPDVTTVIDTGLARVARHSPWSGLSQLELEEISQARATQRAGRAGRTQAGVAVRLYTAGNFSARPRHDPPAVERDDLSGVLLLLAASGSARPDALRWLTPPPGASWQAACDLLTALGALREGELTEIGRRMLRFPTHPRLARLLVEGERRGCAERACLAAALLAERDVRRESRTRFTGGPARHVESGDSDLAEMIDRYEAVAEQNFSRQALTEYDVDGAAARAVERSVRQLLGLVRSSGAAPPPREVAAAANSDDALAHAVLAAFGDRVAQRRGTGRELVLCNGTSALLADTSVLHRAPFLVALSADRSGGKRGQALVRVASRIEPDWLLELETDLVQLEETLGLDANGERVERVSRIRYGRLILDESRSRPAPGPDVAQVLLKAARTKGLAVADPEGSLERLGVRLELLQRYGVVPEDTSGADLVERALEVGCGQVTSLGELAALDLAELVSSSLPGSTLSALREHTPTRLRLPSGRELQVHYERAKSPWIASRLQDFFGLAETPSICRGRHPLQVQLLAPNQRAVQVTTDLAGFWERHYPGIRKELMRRYPRHPWPEDGRTAQPPAPRPPRPR